MREVSMTEHPVPGQHHLHTTLVLDDEEFGQLLAEAKRRNQRIDATVQDAFEWGMRHIVEEELT